MLKKKLREKKGTTLVELTVSFALIALLCMAAVTAVVLTAGAFQSVSERSRSQTVGQLLLDKIAGELAAAQPGTAEQPGLTISDGSGDFAYGACLDYCGRDGSRAYITAADGGLLIRYRTLTDGTGTAEAADWRYGREVYNGFSIPADGLQFEIVTGNVLRITLQLKSDSSGYAYTTERYIPCDNFSDSIDMSKFGYGSILRDG